LGTWRARAEVLGWSDDLQVTNYPFDVAERLHLQPDWTSSLAARSQVDAGGAMPSMAELTDGLEDLFE